MSQLLYAIIALAMVTIFSVFSSRSMFEAEQISYATEIRARMTGVGEDMIEGVGRRSLPFDENTDPEKKPKPVLYPLVRNATELTPKSSFGGCVDFYACEDIDDFDGMELSLEVDSLDLEAEITVDYVEESNPNYVSTSQTFAKKVTIRMWSPNLMFKQDTLWASYSRVFAFEGATDPLYGSGGNGGTDDEGGNDGIDSDSLSFDF